MAFRAVGKWVLVKVASGEKMSAGGVIIPDVIEQFITMGTVRAVGERVNLPDENSIRVGKPVSMDIQVNDVVAFYPNTGTNLTVNGEKLVVLRADDIFGVYDEPEPKKK